MLLSQISRLVTLIIVLTVYWALLSGQTSSLLLITGAVSILLVSLLGLAMGIIDDDTAPTLTWFRLIIYVPYLLWEIVKANWDVIKFVWDPVMDIDPRMIEVPHKTETAFGVTTYANSITLTPGTVTVDIDPDIDELTIHAISQGAADGVLDGGMERQVKKLEGSA